jgi:hypothetical protein
LDISLRHFRYALALTRLLACIAELVASTPKKRSAPEWPRFG